MNQNKPKRTHAPPLPKSHSKPINKTQLLNMKFGNYFSKSPKRNEYVNSPTPKTKTEQKQTQQLFDNFAGTGLMLNSNNVPRLSNSTDTPPSHSNSQSIGDRTSPIFFPPNHTKHTLTNPNNTRYNQLAKEYGIDTASTVSSSDIQDDISSVASDEPYKRPPRNAPPPPPHPRPPVPHRINKHAHSASMTLTVTNMKKYSATPTPKRSKPKPPKSMKRYAKATHATKDTLSIRTDTAHTNNNTRKYSKSALCTPNDSPNTHKVTENELINNPYIENIVDFSAIIEENISEKDSKHTQLNGTLPPPLSPKNSGEFYKNSIPKRPSSATMKGYRNRQGSLPYYEIPNKNHLGFSRSHSKLQPHNINGSDNVQIPPLSKSRSANANDKPPKHKRIAQSVDMTDYNTTRQRNGYNKVGRIHKRANSARDVNDLSLSEKLYQNRRTVLHRLSRGKNKKDVMSKLDISIGKVEEKLKVYVRNLVSLQDELGKCNRDMTSELAEWECINNFSLTNLCRSYYSNFALLIQIRIEIATKYCECFRDKYRQLKKTRDRIKKDAKKFSLDDLVLTVEAAMMTASNIRLPQDINLKRDNEKSLGLVISDLKKKYAEKKYEDVTAPMTAQDRTKHMLTMLVQIIDTSNKTTMTRNVSDGLPYFHPQDNGYQVPFEQLLYDPRFDQKQSIEQFIAKYIFSGNGEINTRIIDKETLSLTKISTFIYKLTNSFLDSCELNKNSPFFQKLFWDCTNLMIGRSIFPKFDRVIKYVIDKDTESVELDGKYAKQLVWMSTMTQKRIGIEPEFSYYYVKKIKSLKQTLKKPKKNETRKGTIFVDEMAENEEKIAYYKPINRLKSLQSITVPQDSIVLVIDTIHDIQKCANKYCKIKLEQNGNGKKPTVISGDSLFPIVVYCLIQSNVDYWNRWLFMMKKFYTQKILSFGQTGFCFSLINAAVTYILEQKPSNFGLDNDLV